jgi:hypothetical protein
MVWDRRWVMEMVISRDSNTYLDKLGYIVHLILDTRYQTVLGLFTIVPYPPPLRYCPEDP